MGQYKDFGGTCAEQTKKILEVDMEIANRKLDLLRQALALEKQELITEYFKLGGYILSLIFLLVGLCAIFVLIRKN